jgi:hypothetical protein
MSDLPKGVGIPHRAAQRNVNKVMAAKDHARVAARPAARQVAAPVQAHVQPHGEQVNDTPNRLKAVDIVAFNQAAELGAIAYLSQYIELHGAPSYNTACSLIALEMDVSTETAKRYLRKYSVEHPKAKFKVENGMVYNREAI